MLASLFNKEQGQTQDALLTCLWLEIWEQIHCITLYLNRQSYPLWRSIMGLDVAGGGGGDKSSGVQTVTLVLGYSRVQTNITFFSAAYAAFVQKYDDQQISTWATKGFIYWRKSYFFSFSRH